MIAKYFSFEFIICVKLGDHYFPALSVISINFQSVASHPYVKGRNLYTSMLRPGVGFI